VSEDELALLRAVCDRPDDDTPRLVYADWLDDLGDRLLSTHAAFIRAQIDWTRRKNQMGDEEYQAASSEMHRLLLSFVHWEGSDWSAGNALSMRLMDRKVGGTGYTRPERWERGFPNVVLFPSVVAWERAAGFDLHGDRMYERVPLRRTRVRGRHPALIRHPGWYWRMASGSVRQRHELPEPVYRHLLADNNYPTMRFGMTAAYLAFTDAGRVRCGLAPRFQLADLGLPAASGGATA
jgi:uncharacterized protein (TIGR02996 family)